MAEYSVLKFAGWATLSRLWPSFVIYLVGVELVIFPHHLDMPTVDPQSDKQRLYVWEQQATTRSCRYPGILSELLVLNFNLHTEHHLFPAVILESDEENAPGNDNGGAVERVFIPGVTTHRQIGV